MAPNPVRQGLDRLAPLFPYLAFFLSGASSLIFQNIWSRNLQQVFGATSIAISTVVTVFMAGLGLGAWIAGRYADRIPHPLLSYALAELLIGGWALGVPWLLDPEGWLSSIGVLLRQELGAESLGLALGRFAAVVPVLLVPTTLMGMTLPLLVRHFVKRDAAAERASLRVGALYGTNTLGAVFGVGLAAFVLLPSIGMYWTNLVALSGNLILGAGILLLHKLLFADVRLRSLKWWPARRSDDTRSELAAVPDATVSPAAADPQTATTTGEAAPPLLSPLVRRAAFWTFVASGAAALCYEVVWTRALAMTIGSSIYGFAIILLAFLIGIGGGSSVASAILGKARIAGSAALALLLLVAAAIPVSLENGTFAAATLLLLGALLIGLCARLGRAPKTAGHFSVGAPLREADLWILAVPAAASLATTQLIPTPLAGLCILGSGGLLAYALCWRTFRTAPVLLIACTQFLIAANTFLSYLVLDEVPLVFARVAAGIDHVPEQGWLLQLVMFMTAGFCVLPSAFGMGAMFPLTIRACSSGGARIGFDVGRIYAGNTLGSIVGAWLPGFVLMPWIGMENTLICGIVLNLALALTMVVVAGASPTGQGVAKPSTGKPAAPMVPVSHAIALYLLAPLIPSLAALLLFSAWGTAGSGPFDLGWKRNQMTLGVFRLSYASDVADRWEGLDLRSGSDILFYADGRSTTVSVEQSGPHIALRNNGKVDASNGGDMSTQIMVAGFPLLFSGEPFQDKDVAVIGFGSGVSVGTALQFPVHHVDVIELERNIPKASRFFQDVNHLMYPGCQDIHAETCTWPYVEHPKVKVINDDGRNFLASTDKKYDVIISEPSNPWIAGVADLFTVEHFRLSRARLKPGGIYCQWVQLYELSPRSIKVIYRTFASQFPYVAVFAAEGGSSDTVMLGSDQPIRLDLETGRARLKRTSVANELARAGVKTPEDALARVLLSTKEEVLAYTDIEQRQVGSRWHAFPERSNHTSCPEADCKRTAAALNTDDNALIEFSAPRDLIGYAQHSGYERTFYEDGWPYGRLEPVLGDMTEGPVSSRGYANLALALMAQGRELRAGEMLERSLAVGRTERTDTVASVIHHLLSERGEPSAVVEPPVAGPELNDTMTEQLRTGFRTIRQAVDDRNYESALVAMERIPGPIRKHSGTGFRYLYGYLLYKSAQAPDLDEWEVTENLESAVSELSALVTEEPGYVRAHPALRYFLARSLDATGEYADAVTEMERYVVALQRRKRELDAVADTPSRSEAAP